MALTVVATYDVVEDGRRARVAATLQRWGDCIQRSVFLCLIDEDNLPMMIDAVESIVNLDTDSFYVFRQCGTCWDSKAMLGQADPPSQTLYWAVL